MKTFEEVYPDLPGTGWLTEGEARLLWDFAGQFEGPVLEVGCYFGRSTVLLANLGRLLLCVDPFDGFTDDHSGVEIRNAWYANIESRGLLNVRQAQCKIEDWLYPLPVGFAYLDGDHTAEGTRAQIEFALDHGAEGIAIHDVNDSGGGLPIKEVALKMLGPWEDRVERLATWRVERWMRGSTA